MDFQARRGVAGSALTLAAMLAALMIAALAPAGSLGAGGRPQVSSVRPTGGPPAGGTSVVIGGAHFTGATAVAFGSNPATSFTVNSASKITAITPAGTGTVDVTVTTPEGTSAIKAGDQFIYGPNVTGVSPDRGSANGGTSVSITGSDLSGATAVEFGSANATSFTVNSQSSITAVTPEGTGKVDVTVVDPEGTSPTSPADQFSYVPAPTVTSVSPDEGGEGGGTEVTITGTNFNEVTAVDFGGVPAQNDGFGVGFRVNSEDSITAFSAEGTGAEDVTVTTAFGGTSLTSFADQFRYVLPPTVTSISPETGPAAGGTAVTITGTNLAEAGTAVHFGSSSAASITVDSQSSITAVSPIGKPGATVDVTVTTLGGTSLTSAADRFRYLQRAPLLVNAVSPSSGPLIGGSLVRITGHAFIGTTAVHFGSASATSFTVKSENTITAIAPAGTGTVDVTVTTPEGTSPTSSADQYSYVASPPTVERVSPSHGRWGFAFQKEFPIQISGANLVGVTAVHFGSLSAHFRTTSPGRLIAQAPIQAGTVDVTVTTPEGTSPISSADLFTYLQERPAVRPVSPIKGPAAGGTTVRISGVNLVGATAVDFGAISATSFSVDTSGCPEGPRPEPRTLGCATIVAVSPPEATGAVEVIVTTPDGSSEGLRLGPRPLFNFVDPTVTDVTPNTGSTAGGTTVTITGSGFVVGTTGTTFKFGSAGALIPAECTSIATCTVVAPAHLTGTVNVHAVVRDTGAPVEFLLKSRTSPADLFTYM